jgi:hypothetical protein
MNGNKKMRTGEQLDFTFTAFSARVVFRAAALVAALAVVSAYVFTSCGSDETTERYYYYLSQGEKSSSPPGDSSQTDDSQSSEEQPITSPIWFSRPIGDEDDSAIKMILRAKMGGGGEPIQLSGVQETVSFDDGTDLRVTGLVLTEETSPAEVTIDGCGQTVRLNGGPVGAPLITVGDGVTLTLQNITLQGLNDNNASLILVADGGELVLGTGAVIMKNFNHGGYGGGVCVEEGGTLTLDGGEISENTVPNGGGGGGVYVIGTFTMKGGTISGNTAFFGGGVYVIGTFTMNDGTISGNTAPGGGGVYVRKGGTFNMDENVATISGNTSDKGDVYYEGK